MGEKRERPPKKTFKEDYSKNKPQAAWDSEADSDGDDFGGRENNYFRGSNEGPSAF